MCGIFGAVGLSVPEPGIKRVLRILEHRGPDGNGVLVDEAAKVTLAHTRLAVIDLETGAQPIASEDGDIVLVANGEIYGFEAIRRSLQAKGHRFHSRSDSEVIIYLYKEYGLACFEHLRGEFAFLLYDRSKRLLIAARDRFGIKPLYLSRLDRGFVFGSEMKAIFASGLAEPKLSVEGLDPLLDRDLAATPFPFEGVEHVPPGSYMTIEVDTLESATHQYWSSEIPSKGDEKLDRRDCALRILDVLDDAVRARLRSDVPVGLYLSGGIDSSFVGALMQRNLNSRLHSFSIAFEGSDRDERAFARRAAEVIGTVHHELTVTREMLWHNLEDALWFSELPFVTLAPVGKFLLSKEARKHVTVVLTGEGADEVFLGYRSFFAKALESGLSRHSEQARRLKLTRLPAPLLKRLSLLLFHRSRRTQVGAARANPSQSRSPQTSMIKRAQESRIAAMPFDILCFLGDREEMAHSLEARLPFLDHRLYDLARTMPAKMKMRGGVEKSLLRDAAEGVLPDDLRMRRKLGFMLTSEKIDIAGSDRDLTVELRQHLSREAFERAAVFSYPTYKVVSWLARLPAWTRGLRRLRRNANKVIMYVMQVHMLHRMFVEQPRWESLGEDLPPVGSAERKAAFADESPRSVTSVAS